jgi:hypothetical protein
MCVWIDLCLTLLKHTRVLLLLFSFLSLQECLEELAKNFPDSPRVNVLTGIRMEASEPADIVLKFYNEQLKEEAANAVSASYHVVFGFRLKDTIVGNMETQNLAPAKNWQD